MAAVYLVFDVIFLLSLSVLRNKSLMIPLSVQKVRESSATNVHKVVENSWNDCASSYLKVETGLLCQPQ